MRQRRFPKFIRKFESDLLNLQVQIVPSNTRIMQDQSPSSPSITVTDLIQVSNGIKSSYMNLPVAVVNNHVVRLSVMTEPYYWHLHPDSDESFLVLEGSLIVEFEDSTIELLTNQLLTIPKNTPHRTRPGNERSVNLTFESSGMKTVRLNVK